MTGQPVGGVAVKACPVARSEARLLVPALMFIALALVGIGAMAITTLTSLALARQRSPETNPTAAPTGAPS